MNHEISFEPARTRRLGWLNQNDEVARMRRLSFRTARFLWSEWLCGRREWFQLPVYFYDPQTFIDFVRQLTSLIWLAPEIQSLELVEKSCRLEWLTERTREYWERIFFVAERAGITEKILEPHRLQPDSPISQAHVELFSPIESPFPSILLYGKSGVPIMELEYRRLPDNTCVLHPIVNYLNRRFPSDCFSGPEIVPELAFHLFNLNTMYAREKATVEISPDLASAIFGQYDADRILTSWFGEWETWEKIDLTSLSGHPLVLDCYDRPREPEGTGFRNAVTMLSRLRGHNRSVKVDVFESIQWTADSLLKPEEYTGTPAKVRTLSVPEFVKEASDRGIDCSALEDHIRLTSLSVEELLSLPPKEYILYPVLKPGTYNLIYGASGVAKTWFALNLALALSQGKSPFPSWEFRGKPQPVLYFAGEMDESDYGERISALLNAHPNVNFHLIREDLDLSLEGDQSRVLNEIMEHKAKVVFFDNLVTLAANGHMEGQFSKIWSFFQKLKRMQVSIELIHHENREGSFKGTAKIDQLADQSIHLFGTGNSEKIELLVKAEKIRNTARSEQPAFRTTFDPKTPGAHWDVFKLTKEERCRLDADDPLDEIGRNMGKRRNNHQLAWRYLSDDAKAIAIIDDMLSGCPDDVIAANLVVREQVLTAFKEEQGLCEDILKKHLPAAEDTATNQTGSMPGSNILAPLIWESIRGDRLKT